MPRLQTSTRSHSSLLAVPGALPRGLSSMVVPKPSTKVKARSEGIAGGEKSLLPFTTITKGSIFFASWSCSVFTQTRESQHIARPRLQRQPRTSGKRSLILPVLFTVCPLLAAQGPESVSSGEGGKESGLGSDLISVLLLAKLQDKPLQSQPI